MEEEIKVLEEFVKENRNWHCIECGYNCEKNMKTEQAIENLISECKKLQEESFEDYKSYFDLVQEDNELLVQKENKIKELEKERDDIYADYQDLGKEKLKLEEKCEELLEKVNYLEKILANQHDEIEDKEAIIKLMAKDIAENKLDEDICRKVRSPEKEECDCYADMYDACYGCVIEYYEKKAKGE